MLYKAPAPFSVGIPAWQRCSLCTIGNMSEGINGGLGRSGGDRHRGSRGIGRAIARALAARGARICINYATRVAEAEAAAGEIAAAGGRVIAVQADVADPDAVRRMVVGAESELGPVSILVNNAGLSSPATLERTMVGRTGRPEDIANAVAFLSAPESGFVTAQVLTIDGGRMDYIGHG